MGDRVVMRNEKERLAKAEARAMHKSAYFVRRVLLRVLREEGRLKRTLHLKSGDVVRLVIFQVWATRYKVSVEYVLRTLLRHWWQRAHKPFGKRSMLGVTVPVLCGAHSNVILCEKMLLEFPGHENVGIWRHSEQMRLLGLTETRGRVQGLLSENNPDESCKIYARRIEHRKKKLDAAAAGQWRRRRRWRNNPWL